MTKDNGNGNTALATQPDIMERPITYRPFMGNTDIVLTANSVLKLIAKPTKSGAMPTPADAIRFAKLCEARGLNPWEGDAFLIGYDGQGGPEFNLITAHQAFLKRAEVHPEFDGMESGVAVKLADGSVSDVPGDFVDEGQALVGGWARVHFKARKIPTYRRLKLSTFSTGRSRWGKDAAGMIVKCAEADALRSSFPTKLGGLYLREEFDAQMESTPKVSIAMPRAIGESSVAILPDPKPSADPDAHEQPVAEESQLPESEQKPQMSTEEFDRIVKEKAEAAKSAKVNPSTPEPGMSEAEQHEIQCAELATSLGIPDAQYQSGFKRFLLAKRKKDKPEMLTAVEWDELKTAIKSKAGHFAV